MDVFQKHFTQDLTEPVVVRHPGGIMFTGDALSDTVSVEVFKDGQPATLGGTVVCKCIRADGGTVAFAGTLSGNVVSATLPAAAFAITGPLAVVLQVVDGGTKMSVLKAVYTVDAGETETAIDPGTVIQDVSNLIAAIEAAIGSIPPEYSALLASIAPTFSASTAYPAGAYVWYNGTLYRFATNHAAGTWTGTDATAAVVSDDLEINWQYNALSSRNLLDDYPLTPGTSEGVTCTANGDGSYTLTGTNSGANGSMFFFVYDGTIPSELKSGRKYRCEIDSSTVQLRFAWYSSISPNVAVGNDGGTGAFITTVRAAANYVAIYLLVPGDTTINETVHPRVYVPIGTKELSGEVEELKSAVDASTGNGTYSFTYGGYYQTANDPAVNGVFRSTSAPYACVKIPCQKGDVFTAHMMGIGGSARAYGIYGSDNQLLDRAVATGGTSQVNGTIEITQDDASYIVFNNKLDALTSGYFVIKNMPIKDRVSALETSVNTLEGSVEILGESKQDVLTFDSAPTVESDNPVKSGGVAIAERVSANSIDGAISELSGKTVYTPDTFGHYYTATTDQIYANMAERLTPSAGYSCMLIEVVPGEVYHIHTHGIGGTNRGWITYEADATRKRYSTTITGTEDKILTIEQDEKYLAINNRTGNGTECWAIKLKNDEHFDFKGKNIAIIGDSICTNGDYIKNGVVNPLGNVPEIVIMQEDVGATLSAYVTAYDVGTELHGSVTIDGTTTTGHTIAAEDVGKEITFVPVQADVTEPPTIIGKPLTYNQESRKVWWEQAMDVYGFNPIPVCWSGSSISSHEGGVSYAWHESTIRKCGIRTPGGMTRTAPDLIIVARGANDFTHSPYAKVEEDYLFNTMHGYPDTDEYLEDGNTKYSFPRACALLVKRLRTAYPNTQIVFCTINYLQRIVDNYPTRTGNTGSTYLMWNECIRNVANAFGCHLIEFDKDGLVYENIADYTVDTNRTHVHPNDTGHKIMGNRAIIDLKKINSMA